MSNSHSILEAFKAAQKPKSNGVKSAGPQHMRAKTQISSVSSNHRTIKILINAAVLAELSNQDLEILDEATKVITQLEGYAPIGLVKKAIGDGDKVSAKIALADFVEIAKGRSELPTPKETKSPEKKASTLIDTSALKEKVAAIETPNKEGLEEAIEALERAGLAIWDALAKLDPEA